MFCKTAVTICLAINVVSASPLLGQIMNDILSQPANRALLDRPLKPDPLDLLPSEDQTKSPIVARATDSILGLPKIPRPPPPPPILAPKRPRPLSPLELLLPKVPRLPPPRIPRPLPPPPILPRLPLLPPLPLLDGLLNRGFGRALSLITILGQVDSYIAERARAVVKKLLLLVDDDAANRVQQPDY